MDTLTDLVRDRRARSITFELPGDLPGDPPKWVEIDPPTMAQAMACVRLDPKPGQPETAAETVVRLGRQAAILLGKEHAHLVDRLQPLQIAEIVGALYVAASALPPDLYVRWQQEQRALGVRLTAIQVLENLEKLSIELAARLNKMPSEVDEMPVADAVALRERILELEKAKANLQATIAGVTLEWRD